MKFRPSYLLLVAGLVSSSCSDVLSSVENDLEKEDLVVFSASNARMITKSGLEYEDFEVGTKYLLYGVEAADTYDWANAVMNKKQSYETDKHLIHYGEDLHFQGRTIDFYGATICSTGEDYPSDNTSSGSAPVISLSMENDVLDDLMYSSNLKNCTRTSGLLQMDFIHALSKIQVEVAKQNDSDDLQDARIHSISVLNTYTSGGLDIVNGAWTALSGATERIFSQTPVTLTTSGTMIKDASGDNAYMLIFPNEDNSKVSLKIEYSINGGEVKSVTCDILAPRTALDSSEDQPFLFRQNHRYTLSVSIANDGVQIVTILPKVYEWIDMTVPSYLGQPVTFGNLMWMDRNLGAISADYENDWYNTIGHYFQFGRNIPYIMDIEKFIEYTGDGIEGKTIHQYGGHKGPRFDTLKVYVMKYSNKTASIENSYYYDDDAKYYTRYINKLVSESNFRNTGSDWDSVPSTTDDPNVKTRTDLILNAVQCIYTYDHLGERVYGVSYVKPSNETATDNSVVNLDTELIIHPNILPSGISDSELADLYKFGFGTKVPGEGNNLKFPTVWTFNNNCGAEYWKPGKTSHDPCPKGWRLPSKTDLEVLMPTQQVSWNSVDYPNGKMTVRKDETTRDDIIYEGSENTLEQIIYGKTGDQFVCYILKNPGTSEAYKLRIMSHYTNDGLKNKRFYSIARYGASSTETTLDTSDDTQWTNPIEIIKYPACGFIVPDTDGTPETVHPDIRSFGTGTVIRTSESNPVGIVPSSSEGFNYVQYMSTTDYQLGIQTNSRRSLGDQIRCVRDINAVD